jgi:hypothetical protein
LNWEFWQNKASGDDEEQRAKNVPTTARMPKKAGGWSGNGFLPGRPGNPGGRPKGTSITAVLREMLDEDSPDSMARVLLTATQEEISKQSRLFSKGLKGESRRNSSKKEKR